MHRYEHIANKVYRESNGNKSKIEHWARQSYCGCYSFAERKEKCDAEQLFIENFAKEMSDVHHNFTYYNSKLENNDNMSRYFKLVHPYNKHEHPLFWVDGYLEYIEDIEAMENYTPKILVECLKSYDDAEGKFKYKIRNVFDYSQYHCYDLPCLIVTGRYNDCVRGNVARAVVQSESFAKLLEWFKENKGKAFYNGFSSHVILGGFELNGMRTKPNGNGWYTCGVRDQLQIYFRDMLILEYGKEIANITDGSGNKILKNMISELVGRAIKEYDIKLTDTQLEAQKLNGEEIHPIDQIFSEGLPQKPNIGTGSLTLFIVLMLFFSLFNIRVYLWVFTTIFFVIRWFFSNK